MILPVLMLRDYGGWGWVVFVIPNVLGAAALGFVLGDASRSRRIVEAHHGACVAFSRATVVYQIFVLGWLGYLTMGWIGPVLFGAFICICVTEARDRKRVIRLAIIVTCLSLLMFAISQVIGGAWDLGFARPAERRLRLTDLVLFAPAALLGFSLCPYLDLTFHRARQSTSPSTGRAAFAAGFGVVFLAMVVFALAYAGAVHDLLNGAAAVTIGWQWQCVVLIHLGWQGAFTTGVHWTAAVQARGRGEELRLIVASLLAVPLVVLAVCERNLMIHGLTIGEIVYRCFLILYGLVFPAYVWLRIIPTRVAVHPRVKRAIWLVTVIGTAPMAYAGFVAGRGSWIIASLIVLVAARAVMEWLPLADRSQ